MIRFCPLREISFRNAPCLVEHEKNHIKGLWHATSDLEGHFATEIPQEMILEVAEAVATAEREGVRVEWIDREIGKTLKARDHSRFGQNTIQLIEQVAVLAQQLDKVASELGRLESEMSG